MFGYGLVWFGKAAKNGFEKFAVSSQRWLDLQERRRARVCRRKTILPPQAASTILRNIYIIMLILLKILQSVAICYNMLAHSLLIMREVLNLTLSIFTALYFLVCTGNRDDIMINSKKTAKFELVVT